MNGGSRILVVDDQEGFRSLLRFELELLGYVVSAVADGEEARARLEAENFDLVITDLRMPRSSGSALLAWVKENRPHLEVIMMSGNGNVETAVEMMKLGVFHFLQKPFEMKELNAVVESALEKRGLRALVAFHEASRAVFSSVRLGDLLPAITRLAQDLLRADEAHAMLAGRGGILCTEEAGPRAEACVAAARQALARPGHEPLVLGEESAALIDGARSVVLYPLRLAGADLGVLVAVRKETAGAFGAEEVRNGTVLAAQAAQALANAKLYGELEEKVAALKEANERLGRAQAQLVQAEKLAAIGRLASSVAHEINNPLTAILGFSDLLQREEGLSVQQREDVRSIHDQSQRCRQIVRNLMEFSRAKNPRRERVDAAAAFEGALRLFGGGFEASGVEVARDFAPGLPGVMADPEQLQQALVNLLANARDAVEGRAGGRVVLRARLDGERVVLSVEDNGPGVKAENKHRLFEPFFTTKPVGKGTGLGLSTSHSIIEQHGGRLRVESEEGAGARFFVELPAHAPAPVAA